MRTVEHLIIGAGAAGASTARALSAAGREVMVAERFSPGHPHGSSHGAVRIFRLAYATRFYVRLAQQALAAWRDLEADAGEQLLDLCGGVDIGSADYLTPIERAMTEAGAAVERIDSAARRFDGVALDEPALVSAETGVIAAERTVAAMLGLAREAGAEIRTGVEARIEEHDDDGVTVLLGDERIRARTCVLAAGPWMPELVEDAGLDAPLTPTRQTVAYFRAAAGIPVVIHRGEALRYAMPPRFGSPGAKGGEHGAGFDASPAEAGEPDGRAVARFSAWVAEALPALDPTPVATETCLYTETPSEDFVLDRVGALVVASACSGHGFKFAPLVGEICAALATGAEPPADLTRFSLASHRTKPAGAASW